MITTPSTSVSKSFSPVGVAVVEGDDLTATRGLCTTVKRSMIAADEKQLDCSCRSPRHDIPCRFASFDRNLGSEFISSGRSGHRKVEKGCCARGERYRYHNEHPQDIHWC